MPVVHQTSLPFRPRLLDQVRDTIRRKHYSQCTEQTYLYWIRPYLYLHDKRQHFSFSHFHRLSFNDRADLG